MRIIGLTELDNVEGLTRSVLIFSERRLDG
jgi:hypothetical protein